MESHSSSSGSSHETIYSDTTGQAMFKSLEGFAKEKYSVLKKDARESDDAQMEFTSAAFNYVRGSELTAKIALRALQSVDLGA
jgi:hypothetical protein